MTTGKKPMIVFATEQYRGLAAKVCEMSGFDTGEVETRDFPDGEHYQRIVSDVAERDIALIGGTISDAYTLRIFDLSCAITKNGARSLTLVLPYFGYSTMDRAVKPGEIVAAKTRARLFSAVPPAATANRVVLVDIHSEGIPYYFEGSIIPVHLYGKPIITRVAKELAGSDFVFGSTDAGRAKWVESLANSCGVQAGVVLKRRLESGKTELRAMSADVERKPVIIYDDMIRSGGSLLQAAEAYKKAGAKSISAIATHGIFCGDALDTLKKSKLFETIVCTDSHPNDVALGRKHEGFLRVESLAPLLSEYLRGSHGGF